MAVYVGVIIGLRGSGRGWMGSFPEPYIDLWSLLRISPQQDTEDFTGNGLIIPHSTALHVSKISFLFQSTIPSHYEAA